MVQAPEFDIWGPNATLRPAFGAVNRITDEATFDMATDGVFSEAVDAANVAMVRLDLPSGNFEHFETEHGTWGVNVNNLHDLLGDISKRNMARLVSDGNSEVRVIDVANDHEVGSVPLIDPDSVRDRPDIPELDWRTTVEVPGDQFSRVIRASRKISDHIGMGVGPTDPADRDPGLVFRVEAEGDVDEILGYPDFEFVSPHNQPSEPTRSVYSLDSINDFRLGIDRPASTDVRLTFATDDFPFKMEFSVGDPPGGDVLYLMAPRIQSGSQTWSNHAVDSNALSRVDWRADMDGERGTAMFETFGAFSDEYKVLVNELGLESRVVDPANVAMIANEVDPSYFDSFEEVDGFPGEPIGLNGERINDLMRLWRKNDDLEFAGDKSTRMASLKHDIFTARVATIDPDSLRQEPTLPEGETLTGQATVSAGSFVDAAKDSMSVTDHLGVFISDGELATVGIGDDESVVRRVDASDVRGRALSLFSGDFMEQMLDTFPGADDASVEIRAGFEFPIAVDTERFDGTHRALYIIAPRITGDDSDFLPDAQAALLEDGLSSEWVADRQDGAREPGVSVSLVEGFETESIEERMRLERLTTFPIESRVHLGLGKQRVVETESVEMRGFSSQGDLTIGVEDAEDMAVPDETIERVLDEVEETLDFQHLDSGETVARVTFQDESSFSLQFVNVQPEFEYRFQTADGTPMRQLVKETNDYAYVSEERSTPARTPVVARATAVPDGDFVVQVELKDDGEPTVISEHRTIGNAYGALLDYLGDRNIEQLVRDPGGTVTLTDRDVEDALSNILDRFVDYRLEGKPGQTAPSTDFYAAIIGRQNILPDAAYRADINVMKPGTESDEGYLVRHSLGLEASGPGDARVTRGLVENTVGVAESRTGIEGLVREAFDQLGSFGDVFARTERRPAPPRSPEALPSPRPEDGEISEYVEAYLPAPKQELFAAMDNHGLVFPREPADVEGIGPSRADTLREIGIMDMLDYVALTGSKSTGGFMGVSDALFELPESARMNLEDAGERIWTEIIWPRRDAPTGFEPPDGEPEEPSGPPEPSVPAGFEPPSDIGNLVRGVWNPDAGSLRYIPAGGGPSFSLLYDASMREMAVRRQDPGDRQSETVFPDTGMRDASTVRVAAKLMVDWLRENVADTAITREPLDFELIVQRDANTDEPFFRLRGEISRAADPTQQAAREAVFDAIEMDVEPTDFEAGTVIASGAINEVRRGRNFERVGEVVSLDVDRDAIEAAVAGEPELPPEVRERTREDPPIPPMEIRENVRALGLPVEFGEIDGMGPSRIKAFTDAGLRDMVDVALTAGFARAPIAVQEALEELPRDLRQRVDQLAEQIHDDAILDAAADGKIPRRRDGPPGPFAFFIPSDLRNPDRRIQNEIQQRGATDPETIDTEAVGDGILVTVRGASVIEEEPEIVRVVREEADQWACDPETINAGECDDFAVAVDDRIDGVRIVNNLEFAAQAAARDLAPGAEHVWVEFEGRHYDAEVVEGVADWRDLPFFNRFFPDELISDAFIEFGIDSGIVHHPEIFPLPEADVAEEPPEPVEEPEAPAIPDGPGEWSLGFESDDRVTWILPVLVGAPATVPRDAQGDTFVDARQGRSDDWFVRLRWEWDGEQETSRRGEFTRDNAKERAVRRAVEVMDDNQPTPGEPAEPAIETDVPPEREEIAERGVIEATPVVLFEGGTRTIRFPDIDVTLDQDLRQELIQTVAERIDPESVPSGEPLGTIRIAVDGVQDVDLKRGEELMRETPEDVGEAEGILDSVLRSAGGD